MFSPFEQFIISNNYVFSNINNIFPNIKFFVTNITMILFVFFFILILNFFFMKTERRSYNINIHIELLKGIYKFIYTNLTANLSLKVSNTFFKFYSYLFIFIVVSNLIGILPYNFAITSHITITLTLSIIVCLSNLILGFKVKGISFFNILYARGVPFVLIPFLIAIELVSYLFRSISLSLRLFANVVAGHILLDTLNILIFKILFIKYITINSLLLSIIPILFGIILLIFEIFVSILQGYIFVILSIIFLKDVYNEGH